MVKGDESLIDLFRDIASRPEKRDRVVLVDKNRKWTLGELDDITDSLAKHFLHVYKCKKGSCVGIYMNKCAEYVFSYIAALKAGAAYLPLDITYPEPLLLSVLEEAQPIVVCTFPDYIDKLPEGTPAFNFGPIDWKSTLENDVTLPNDLAGDDLAYIVYSSGTTGKPKGIACPHRGAVFSYKYRFDTYPYQEDDIVAANVFFVWELFRPILQGVTLTIIPDDVIYDPVTLCQFLKNNSVTRMLFTPSLLETVFDTQSEDVIRESFKTMRIIWLCGEVVTCALLKRVMSLLEHVTIANLYSISECHDVSYENLNEFYARKEDRKFAPAGKIIPGVKVLVLDNALKKVPIGVQGEIYVAGPTLAKGYINRPEINKKRFLIVPEEYQAEYGTRMYRTGDWGYMLPNATLEVCGRCDTLVKIRGYSVEVQAIETTLLKLPWISSCAVVSIGEEGQDKHLAAYMVLKEPITRKVLRAELKKHLPFYMVPSYFVFVDRMPVLPASSKIDKKALPPVNRESDIAETEALPQTATEHKLAKIWSEVLGHPTIDIQESFFDLGGHSLTAARLLSKVNMEFGRNLSICDLFTAPTIYGMAKILDGSDTNGHDSKIDLEAQVESHDVKDNISDLHLRAFWRSTEWHNRFHRAHVLLTGSTGFLGVHILASLLQNSQTRIMCLIRESTTETVDMRLEKALKNRGLWTQTIKEQLKDRVKAVNGDVALTNLGLSDEYYHFLTYDIDVVVHAAAYVNLIYPYHALHGVNVLGTRNVLDFCHANKIKPLHYISTDGIISAGLKNVDENYPIENCRNELYDGYGQSKYVAEQLVNRALSRGLPSVIYRLGNQAADTVLGRWNEQDFTYLLLRACIMIGQAPRVDWTVELTPVDFSSKFITEIMTNLFVGNVGKTFHLMNTRGPQWSVVLSWLRKFGYNIEEVDFKTWKQRILNSADRNLHALQKLIEVMMTDESFFSSMSTYKRSNTDSVLQEISWKYPTLDEALMKFWVNQLIEQSVIPSPKVKAIG